MRSCMVRQTDRQTCLALNLRFCLCKNSLLVDWLGDEEKGEKKLWQNIFLEKWITKCQEHASDPISMEDRCSPSKFRSLCTYILVHVHGLSSAIVDLIFTICTCLLLAYLLTLSAEKKMLLDIKLSPSFSPWLQKRDEGKKERKEGILFRS